MTCLGVERFLTFDYRRSGPMNQRAMGSDQRTHQVNSHSFIVFSLKRKVALGGTGQQFGCGKENGGSGVSQGCLASSSVGERQNQHGGCMYQVHDSPSSMEAG